MEAFTVILLIILALGFSVFLVYIGTKDTLKMIHQLKNGQN